MKKIILKEHCYLFLYPILYIYIFTSCKFSNFIRYKIGTNNSCYNILLFLSTSTIVGSTKLPLSFSNILPPHNIFPPSLIIDYRPSLNIFNYYLECNGPHKVLDSNEWPMGIVL